MSGAVSDEGKSRRSGIQTWDPERYASGGRFVADLGEPVIEWLKPVPGERILDLGCGDGALTARLAGFGCDVVAVDGSAELIKAARALGLDARVQDARELGFADEFDAVFSNAALHWIDRPDVVIANVWRALKPGGRFVGEMGGHENIESIVSVLNDAFRRRGLNARDVNPWYFPDAVEYRERLEAQGFVVRRIELIPRPTRLPGDLAQWMDIFGRSFTSVFPEADGQLLVEEVQAALKDSCCDANGNWTIQCVRLRFEALKPRIPA